MPRARRRTETPTITPEAYRQLVYRQMSEAVFQRHTITLALALGWKVHHTRPARKAPQLVRQMDADGRVTLQVAQEWVTPIIGHPGYPDLTLAKYGRMLVPELKAGRNVPTPEQWEWLVLLATMPAAESFVWYPRHTPMVERWLSDQPDCLGCGAGTGTFGLQTTRFSKVDPRIATVCATCGRVVAEKASGRRGMSRQDEVISFALARALHTAGVPQDSDLSYNQSGHLGYFAHVDPHDAALTMHDLIILLGDDFGILEYFPDSGHFEASIQHEGTVYIHGFGKTPQEAMGYLLVQVWGRRNGAQTHQPLEVPE